MKCKEDNMKGAEGGGGGTGKGGRRGHLDVCIKCVGSKNGASTLVSLSLVLLKGGNVAGVSVGKASNGYGDISPGRLHLYRANLTHPAHPVVRAN